MKKTMALVFGKIDQRIGSRGAVEFLDFGHGVLGSQFHFAVQPASF